MKFVLIYSTDEKFNHKKDSWRQVGTKIWNSKEEMDTDESIDNYAKINVPNIDDCWVEEVDENFYKKHGTPYRYEDGLVC